MMTIRSRRIVGIVATLLAGVLVSAFVFAGCSQTTSSDSSAPAAASGDRAGAPGGVAAPSAAADQPQKEGSPQQAPAKVEPQQRSLIYTGTMSVTVDDVVKRADEAADIATGSGGVIGADKRTLNDDRSEAQLVLRIPVDRFDATLDQLAKLGVEESRAVSTQDVTEALIDLDARLATQKASVERVRALLARAQTIGEIVSIESELTKREAELASLQQRKDKLAGQVALSTITLSLRGPAAPEPAREDTGFVAGLRNGWSAFLGSITLVLTVAGWLLPWLLAIGVPVWLLVWQLRRRRRPAPVPSVATGAAPEPGP
jgi:hypothetical protein